MELKEFQGLALRTESQIQGISLNRDNLITLLTIVVEVTEILDGIKKAAFYNKTTKLEGNLLMNLLNVAALTKQLVQKTDDLGPVGATIDANETIANLDPRVFHGILGIITESGELAAAMLKVIEDPELSIDAVNIQEEMSDIAWYKAILHDTLGLDWNQGLINVINKLSIRYADKYSDYAAANRDLAAERAALEVGVTTGWPLKEVQDVAADDLTIAHDYVTGKFDAPFIENKDFDTGEKGWNWSSSDAATSWTNDVLVSPVMTVVTPGRRTFYIDIPDDMTTEEATKLVAKAFAEKDIA